MQKKTRQRGFQLAVATSQGGRTQTNQDRFVVDFDIYLFMLVDGLTAHPAGDVASALVTETAPLHVREAKFTSAEGAARALCHSLVGASEALRLIGSENVRTKGMGAAAVAALMYGEELFIANVGDSAGFLLRDNAIIQISRDQTIANAFIDARKHTLLPESEMIVEEAFGKKLAEWLGDKVAPRVALSKIALRRGDRVLLTTNGLTGRMKWEQIGNLLGAKLNPRRACAQLIAEARAAGAEDDVTVLIIDFTGDQFSPPTGQDYSLKREPYRFTTNSLIPPQ